MYFDKAIRILGIEPDFTEEELKMVYRSLMRKYHPDANIGKSEEKLKKLEDKAKEVNSAYEYLVKNFQTKSMDEYITFLYNELLKFNEENVIYPNILSELDSYQKDIKTVIRNFCAWARGQSKKEIDRLFQEAKKVIRTIFEDLCDTYFKRYSIDIKYKKKLNYETSLQDFYEQLEEIKEKFFEQVINKEIEKYRNYKGYDYLKDWIEITVVHNFKVYIKKEGLEKAILMMQEDVEELFELYFKILGDFNKIKEMLADNTNHLSQEFLDSIKQKYDEVLVSFQKKSALAGTSHKLYEIKEKIEQQIQLENQIKKYDVIYQKVMSRYWEQMINYQTIYDIAKRKRLMMIIEKVLCIFELAKDGKIDYNSLMAILAQLTFEDEVVDANILSSIDYDFSVDENNIYFRKYGVIEVFWYILIKKGENFFLRYYNPDMGYTEDQIIKNKQSLEEEYISFAELIKEMKSVGVTRKFLGVETTILYSNGVYNIILRNGDLAIEYNHYNLEKTNINNIPIEYQNKEYVKMKLIEMIQNSMKSKNNWLR